jgi:hypothetical protein
MAGGITMAYTKTAWVARVGSGLNRYAKANETATHVYLTQTPDSITIPGTPFNVADMNKLEQGVYDAHQMAENNYNMFHHVGKVEPFLRMPTPAQLATWRMLPLQGQVISVVQYAELCDAMWVGAAANATADWWYRTSDAAGTVRDPNGAYMRVLDIHGLFLRAAGQNSKYKMASGAPYDGGAIGTHIADAIQNIAGQFGWIGREDNPLTGGAFFNGWNVEGGATFGYGDSGGKTLMAAGFDASRVVRTANEVRSASMSALFCIAY